MTPVLIDFFTLKIVVRKNYGIGAYIENLKNKIQLRQLKDITLLTPATKQHLEELAQSRISDMNFTRYRLLVVFYAMHTLHNTY